MLRDRRLKSTLLVLLVWITVSLLHWLHWQWLSLALTAILTVQSWRMLLAKPSSPEAIASNDLPEVSILVPAKNESAVLTNLVSSLYALEYPKALDIWIIDDGSTDSTPEVLERSQVQFPTLKVHRRISQGGKSGALNAVLPLTKGEIILVCDADAQLHPDFLMATVPLFQGNIGAIQASKAVSNADRNFLTKCQQMELICDRILQTHRLAAGGMAELRGNGMLVRRDLLEKCDGWSEDTLTDDLDLTFKLYLVGTEIIFVTSAIVGEEGVTNWHSLWNQRCRWTEGGYHRYLDYFPQILTLGWIKDLDLLLFFLLQFLLPVALIPDLLWTIFYSHQSVLFPLQTLLGAIVTVSFLAGLYQFQNLRGLELIWQTLIGSLYMLHWIPVMLVTIVKLSLFPQRLNWYKSPHGDR